MLPALNPTTPVPTPMPANAAQAVLRRHNVHVLGAGQPLLFCNGFNCSQRVWHLLTPVLVPHYQLILFDQMGVGQSDRSAYDLQQYATLAGYA